MTVAEIKENLQSQTLPKYSKGEECFNFITHAIGIVIGLIALGAFIALTIMFDFNIWQTMSLIFFAISMIFLYSTSTIYHALSPKSVWKKLFRLLDHNTIYLLIAGTYANLRLLSKVPITVDYHDRPIIWSLNRNDYECF